MRRVAIVGERQATLVTAEMPEVPEGWALVRIKIAPMCTEYKMFLEGTAAANIGHEASGEVVRVGAGSTVRVGDRVVVMPRYPCGSCELCERGDFIYCQNPLPHFEGTMAEFIAKPSWLLPRIPDHLSYEEGALACCGLGPSFGALERMRVDRFTTVVITGLGPVGLGAVINAKYRGATVIAVDLNPYRLNLAGALGADHVLDARDPDLVAQIRGHLKPASTYCGLDCSGSPTAHRLLIEAAPPLGRIAFVGECEDTTTIRVSPDLIRTGLTVMGSWHYNLHDIGRLFRTIGEADARRMVTHVYGFDQVQEAFETSASQQCGKVLLRPEVA
jgi:L-iditol 2-dehydrogenase